MFKSYLYLLFIFCFINSYPQKKYEYSLASKDSTFDVYFNKTIKDPYQWMENPDDPRLLEWLESQEKLKRKTENHFLHASALRGQISAMYYGVREKEIDGYVEKDSSLNSKYQFKYNTQRINRFPNLLYRLRDDGNYKMLVDIKKYRKDKEDHVAIINKYVNEDYDLIAIEMSHNGSDWHELYFFNLKNGEQLYNSLNYLRAGSQVIWDDTNVYYDRYDKPQEGREHLDKATGQKLYYHLFGKPQSEDHLLYINPDSTGTNNFTYFKLKDKLFFYNAYRHGGKIYRALSVANSNPDAFHLKIFLVYPNNDSLSVNIEEAFGNQVILRTNWNAPNGRVLMSNINEPNKPEGIVPEYDVILTEVNRLGKDKIACIYRNENKYLALIYDLQGNLLKKIDFPEGKKVNFLYEKQDDAEYTDFCVSSFCHPNLWYQLSLKDLTFKPSVSISVPYDPESLETRYVKYTSKDGTQIPMYITCLKKTKLDGKNPTLLYGYGGYGMTVEPSFNESMALWLLHGGILAIPNVRGGGVAGHEWGREGRRLKKQNAIDDFIAAAEYLINEKYTSHSNLGSNGGSHGGLLVAAAAIQRPNLFKAVVAEAGPFDMLRFGKFTVGSVNTNINEFGTITDSLDFNNLRSYSPLQNVKDKIKYPNFLLITGDQDDRVPPFHTYKFLATLQEKGDPHSLSLIYLTPGSGHGGALTSEDWIDKLIFKYSFLYDQLF